ncbi:30S ribosomal protein S9 [Bremerella cremea]|uniref:Small ribosomal subunit protein uS9 n=1 Tax=Blastopirellula marina TaxID=124 RepID=A0A2S8FAT7_9BACT|nr:MULTISPECIES: 30S ribosomal protein S9 [Pirellulaceae]PQO29267.1 30S ribosomal protein S9 [Blastopirellula marina]RCS42572.1 30S ribosomal protein S9 [Bremerella cremea]
MSTADPQSEDVQEEVAVETTTTTEVAEPAPVKHVKKTDPKTGEHLGTGRRKSSVARVRIKPGSGKIAINDRELSEYFPHEQDQNAVMAPLRDSGYDSKVDVRILVTGGGPTGQSGACRMGLGRALLSMDPEVGHQLKDNGHLTRDSRMKERKKYGLHGARRGTQFSKR